jgi:apolipoprotein N-acyltransferase
MWPWIAAVTGGILLFLGYAGFDHFYLEWVFLLPVLWAIRGQRPGRAFLLGWLAGAVGHAGGFYWVIGMFQVFAGFPWPVAAVGLLLLAAANGLLVGVWAWSTSLATRRARLNVVWFAPVAWTALEKFWPEIFPNYLGASQYQLHHLTQIADLTGILGVSFLVVAINATLYAVIEAWHDKRVLAWRPLAGLAVALLLVLGYGQYRIAAVDRQAAAAEKITVGLVQTNRGGADKYGDPELIFLEHQLMSGELTRQRPLDLVVWPEGVCDVTVPPGRQGRMPVLGKLATPVLLGSVVREAGRGETRTCNSAILTDAAGRIVGTYDKTILMPFGEYIPLGDLIPQLYSWSPYSSGFRRGVSEEPLPLGKHLLSVSICYEDIFPGQIRMLMRGGHTGRRPGALFNLTNDSWYGRSIEPMEHLALASFRSIENRRTLVRVTNTGVSAFVDPVGRIVSRTGVWTKETLVEPVPMLEGSTVYAQFGDWLGWLCILISAACIGQALRVLQPGKPEAEDERDEPGAGGKKAPQHPRG